MADTVPYYAPSSRPVASYVKMTRRPERAGLDDRDWGSWIAPFAEVNIFPTDHNFYYLIPVAGEVWILSDDVLNEHWKTIEYGNMVIWDSKRGCSDNG